MIQRHIIKGNIETHLNTFDYFNDADDTIRWLKNQQEFTHDHQEKKRIGSVIAVLENGFQKYIDGFTHKKLSELRDDLPS